MELLYIKSLGKGLQNYAACQKKYGSIADRVWSRMSILRQIDTLKDLRAFPGYHCHELTGKHNEISGCLAIKVTANVRLIFVPTADPPPLKKDGGLCWDEVESITVVDICDYH